MTDPQPPPSGTVTFLFTDIEGSTGLEQRVGTDALRAPLRERHRDDPARRRGRRTAASSRAPRATRSSSSSRGARRRSRRRSTAQRRARGGAVAGRRVVRVRMGIHSGEAELAGGGLRRARHQPGGADRGGRPRRPDPRLGRDPGAGRGATCPTGVRLRDLGEFRLKDLLAPEPAHPGRRRRPAGRLPAAAHARRASEQPADPADDVHRSRRRARRRRPGCSPRPGC